MLEYQTSDTCKRPNFFIIGAPKCGTTSLAAWLAGHPNIFMSIPKELYYFSKDMHTPLAPKTLFDYERFFASADSDALAIGEASTIYFMSAVAVREILDYRPEAKFLVCLRNPVDMVPSLHMHSLRSGVESEVRLERAWELQNDRAAETKFLKGDVSTQWFQYGRRCLLGSQMERLLSIVPRDRIHVIFTEEMKSYPDQVYNRALEFLDVPPDDRTKFPTYNKRPKARYLRANRVIQKLGILKRKLGVRRSFGIASFFNSWLTRSVDQNELPTEFRLLLEDYFYSDIKKLSRLLNKDLSHWVSLKEGVKVEERDA